MFPPRRVGTDGNSPGNTHANPAVRRALSFRFPRGIKGGVRPRKHRIAVARPEARGFSPLCLPTLEAASGRLRNAGRLSCSRRAGLGRTGIRPVILTPTRPFVHANTASRWPGHKHLFALRRAGCPYPARITPKSHETIPHPAAFGLAILCGIASADGVLCAQSGAVGWRI
jgi:hypothetical protein